MILIMMNSLVMEVLSLVKLVYIFISSISRIFKVLYTLLLIFKNTFRIPMIKMMKKLMQFMKQLINEWMKNVKNIEKNV